MLTGIIVAIDDRNVTDKAESTPKQRRNNRQPAEHYIMAWPAGLNHRSGPSMQPGINPTTHDDEMTEQRHCHKKAFDYISRALKIDEEGTGGFYCQALHKFHSSSAMIP